MTSCPFSPFIVQVCTNDPYLTNVFSPLLHMTISLLSPWFFFFFFGAQIGNSIAKRTHNTTNPAETNYLFSFLSKNLTSIFLAGSYKLPCRPCNGSMKGLRFDKLVLQQVPWSMYVYGIHRSKTRLGAHFYVPAVPTKQNRVHWNWQSFCQYLRAPCWPSTCMWSRWGKLFKSTFVLLSNMQVGMWPSSHLFIFNVAWLSYYIDWTLYLEKLAKW